MDPIQLQILTDLDRSEQDRLLRYQRAWQYYHGEPARPMKVMPGRPDDNVVFDLPRQIVDTGVSFLFGDDLDVSVAETLPPDTGVWLDETLDRCAPGGEMLLYQRLALNGAVTGHSHAKIQPTSDGRIRVLVLDPQCVTADWNQDDVEDVTRWTITWTALGTNGPIAKRQRIERASESSWTIFDEESAGSRWVATQTTTWAFPFSPIVHCQNLPCPNEYYGLADLEPSLLDLADAINRVGSHIAKLVRVHGFPKIWTKGVGDASVIELGMDTILQLPDTASEIGYLQNPGDISASLALYDRLKGALMEQARIPDVATGKLDNTGQLSGRALKIMYGPLVDKTESKRRTYGHMLEDLCNRLLVVGGKTSSVEDGECELHWPEILPGDPMEEAQTLQAHVDLGVVSRETVASKLGYDYAAESEKLREEQAGALDAGLTDPRSPDLLSLPPGMVSPNGSAGSA